MGAAAVRCDLVQLGRVREGLKEPSAGGDCRGTDRPKSSERDSMPRTGIHPAHVQDLAVSRCRARHVASFEIRFAGLRYRLPENCEL